MVVVERLDVAQTSPSITCKFEMVYASLHQKHLLVLKPKIHFHEHEASESTNLLFILVTS